MLGVKVEQVNAKLGHAGRVTAVLISASRTLTWRPSVWECRGRRLSRGKKTKSRLRFYCGSPTLRTSSAKRRSERRGSS